MTDEELRNSMIFLVEKYVVDDPHVRQSLIQGIKTLQNPPGKAVLYEVAKRSGELTGKDLEMYEDIVAECM